MSVELPHFRYPFGRTADGSKVAVVEQQSDEHVLGQIHAVVVTPEGHRLDHPGFGWPYPEFVMLPLDLTELEEAIEMFVPDADFNVTEWASAASEAVRHVRIEETEGLMAFISIPFTTDAVILADDALTRLSDHWGEDWEANDGDLEVIQISVLAPMVQEALEVAADVPDAVFREFGTKLAGLPYQSAVPATGTATFEALDSDGYDSDGPVVFLLGGITFQTDESVVIPALSTTVDAEFTASEAGVLGNDLSGSADVISALPWVLSITVTGTTTGGLDAEDDVAYRDRLAAHLKLGAVTLVTGRDFEIAATQMEGVGRALAIVGTAREVTVAILNETGGLVTSTEVKDELEAMYDEHRQVNTVYDVIDPTLHTINVTLEVIVSPGWVAAEVQARVEAALDAWLDPMRWGSDIDVRYDRWVLEDTVRLNEVIRVAGVEGVRYVEADSVLIEGVAADYVMSGTVPVTTPGPHTVIPTPLVA